MSTATSTERTVEEWAELGIEEYEIEAAEAYQHEILGAGYEFSEDDFRDHYQGEYDSPEDYVEHCFDEGVMGSEIDLDQELFNGWGTLRYYLDFGSMADDLDKAGMYFLEAPSGGVFVFDA